MMKFSATTEGEPRLVDDVKAAFKECVELREENAQLRTRLQQVEGGGLLVTTTQQRDAVQALYDAGLAQWEPVYKLVLDERDSLRVALQQAEAERDGELERKLQAQEDAADAIKRANELADEVNAQIQRAHGFKVERDEAWAVLRQMCEERTERFKQLADLQRERQVALQAAERKITRLEEQRVGIKRPV